MAKEFRTKLRVRMKPQPWPPGLLLQDPPPVMANVCPRCGMDWSKPMGLYCPECMSAKCL